MELKKKTIILKQKAFTENHAKKPVAKFMTYFVTLKTCWQL